MTLRVEILDSSETRAPGSGEKKSRGPVGTAALARWSEAIALAQGAGHLADHTPQGRRPASRS